MIKNSLFSRRSHELFTLYCDEVQNLMAFDAGLDTILSESRKFGISVVSANQFLDQYPPAMRSAILAVGTHVLFQLASGRSEEHTSELQSPHHLQSFPTRRSSDLAATNSLPSIAMRSKTLWLLTLDSTRFSRSRANSVFPWSQLTSSWTNIRLQCGRQYLR